MWDIIWKGRFPKKVVINHRESTEEDLNRNVTALPTKLYLEHKVQNEIRLFEKAVIEIIDRLIDESIEDYLKYKKVNKDDEFYELDKSELTRKTTSIWESMFTEARTIEETINHIWNDDDVWVEFTEHYILWVIEWLLNTYRWKIFWELVKNEKKIKNNK